MLLWLHRDSATAISLQQGWAHCTSLELHGYGGIAAVVALLF